MSVQVTERAAEDSYEIPGLKDDERRKAAEIIQVLFSNSQCLYGAELEHRKTIEATELAGS